MHKSSKKLPSALKKMNAIVKNLAKTGKYSGNIMKAASKVYKQENKSLSKRRSSRKSKRCLLYTSDAADE